MSKELWTAVDDYITSTFLDFDAALDHALESSAKGELPAINVSPAQGKMLMILAQSIGARSILEIGTLGAYSTIWLAKALPPGGTLISLEYEPKHAAVAKDNIAFAGFADKVEIMVGAAGETLPKLRADKRAPFDLIFIDADKEGYSDYFTKCLNLSHPGTLIIADNVVRDGNVIDPQHGDSRVQGIRHFNEKVRDAKNVSATAIQTVGNKGYDGFALIRVIDV